MNPTYYSPADRKRSIGAAKQVAKCPWSLVVKNSIVDPVQMPDSNVALHFLVGVCGCIITTLLSINQVDGIYVLSAYP